MYLFENFHIPEKIRFLVIMTVCTKPPPKRAKILRWALFGAVFCDFFKSYGSNTKTIIMFFVVLCKVVSLPKRFCDQTSHSLANRKKQAQKMLILSPF